MRKKSNYLLLPLLLFAGLGADAQQWTDNLPKLKSNQPYTYYDYTKAFHQFWNPRNVENGFYIDETGKRVKAPGWKQFRRWEYYSQFRVDPQTGEFPQVNRIDISAEEKMLKSAASLGNWTAVGPSTSPGGYHGLGRINYIGFRPGDENTLYAGSPSGGLWKTIDAGATWTPKTDDNAAMGVSAVVVFAGATTATDTVFIGTGDRDGGAVFNLNGGQSGDNNGVGVLKSVDGGTTWSTTGLTFEAKEGKRISRLLVDPNNKKIMLASVLGYFSNQGEVHRTTDGGVTWTKTSNIRFIDMDYKPGSSTTVYASTPEGEVHRSLDGGVTFTKINLAFGDGRIELAVSPAEPNSVWAVVVSGATRGLDAIFKSSDSGNNWVYLYQANASGKYLLGYECNASDNKGQGEYDLYLAVDPANASKMYLGGVNQYRSTDGGLSWTLSSHWSSTCTNTVTTVHGDQHFCAVHPVSGHVWTGNDGGVYRSTDNGVSWEWRGDGLVINQIYRIGVAQTVASHYILGSQDNGTKRYDGTWQDGIGGDGADAAIDPSDVNTQYGSSEGGKVFKTSTNWSNPNGTEITLTVPGGSGKGDWITPFVINPKKTSTLLIGYKQLYRSTNGGSTWSSMGLDDTGNYDTYIASIAYAPSDTNTIYVANNKTNTLTAPKLRKTTNSGASWTDITAGLPVNPSLITGIAVHHEHNDTVWVSLGQYNEHGVYQSFDGGATWTNISTGLPQVPVMGVVENKLAASGMELYAATDIGVYMKEGNANWTRFSNDLPNVVVSELEIYYDEVTTSNSKLVAGTYGRGIWVSDLYTTATPPVADFDTDNRFPGVGDTITLIDQSTNVPSSWSWSFSPATVTYVDGTSASSPNPKVKFSAQGKYDVSLTVTNSAGNNSVTKTAFIEVSDLPTGYCAANSNNGFAAIKLVNFAGINQSSSFTAGGYADYSQVSADVKKGKVAPMTIELETQDTEADVSVFIDWNRDADFDDADEHVGCGAINNAGIKTFTLTIPAWASVGKTKMRIRSKYFNTDCASPCGVTGNGEVEDYSLIIQDSIGTVAPVAEFEAHDLSVSINHYVQLTDKSTNVPNTWAWSFSPDNAVYKNGTTNASANPVVAFTTAGNYSVTLTSTNAAGNDSETKTNYITVNPAVYCDAHSTQGIIGISNVQLGTINKTSQLNSPYYSDYSATDITSLEVLSTNTLHVTVLNNQSANDVFAWIDWNGDGTFTDAGELIGSKIDIGAGNDVVSFQFAVPGTAELVNTRLRVRTAFNAQPNQSPCGDTPYGEVEDYGISIIPGNALWMGGTTDWDSPSNWSINAVPNDKVNVTIPNPILGGNEPVINRNVTADVNNINVANGSKLIIRSNVDKTGSLIVHGSATGTGKVRFRRFVSGNNWHLIAPPVEGQGFWDFATDPKNMIANKGIPLQYAITTYDETADNWNSYPTADPGGNLEAGKGYSVLTTADTALYIDGTVKNTDISLTLTRGNHGWNLLGNPYTSAIKATTVVDATHTLLNAANVAILDQSYAGLYLWQPTSATTGSYVIINNAGGIPTGTLAQNYIQAGQAFFVKAQAGGGNFNITRAMQAHSNDAAFKSGETTWPAIQLQAENGSKKSSTVIAFNNRMTNGLDVSYDAGMFKADKNFSLYSRLVTDNGVDFAIQALPENYNKLIVPLGIDVPAGTAVTFSALAMNLPGDAAVYLEDRAAKTITQLDVAGANYTVTITDKTKGTGNFFLHTSSATTAISELETNLQVYTRDRAIYISGNLETTDVVSVVGIDGKLHYKNRAAKTGLLRIDAAKIPAGVYLVNISGKTERVTKKVVITE